jgi:hypothetical protein
MRFLTRAASKNLRTAKGEAEWDRRRAEYLRVCTLHFTGVRNADIPDRVTHDSWLYNEIDQAEDGCGELRVLLRESEIWIASRDVECTTNFDDAA